MTNLTKWNPESETMPSLFPGISNLLESFFGRDLWNDNFGYQVPSVNITENRDNYLLEVAAPGMNKKDFSLNVDGDLLTIKAIREEKKEDKGDSRYTRREFNYSSFQRTFSLPDTVDAERISAEYKDGVLSITLPKKEEAKEKPAREIKIS